MFDQIGHEVSVILVQREDNDGPEGILLRRPGEKCRYSVYILK